MLLAVLLPLCVAAAQVDAPLVELASPSGRHRMLVRRIGDDDPRPARRGRYEIEVREERGARGVRLVWTALVDAPQATWTWLLSDDGSTVARVDAGLAPTPRVEVWNHGRRSASLDPRELDLGIAAVHADGTWIHPSPETLRLRPVDMQVAADGQALDLLAHDGALRTVRGTTGAVTLSADAAGEVTRIVPAVPADAATTLVDVWVRSWSGPDKAVAGGPIELRVHGEFPTAGWRIAGFGVMLEPGQEEGAPAHIVVTPWAAQPSGGAAATQAITHFDERCALFVQEPGRYVLEVRGRKHDSLETVLRELEVRPTALLVSLSTSGGPTGRGRTIEVLRDGRIRGERGTRLVALEPYFELVDAVAALPRASLERLSSTGSDLVRYELAWAHDGVPYAAVLDDTTRSQPFDGVVEALLALDAPGRHAPAGPPRWVIDPEQGSFVVKTGSAGLFGAFGHNHDFAVRDFEGAYLGYPERPGEASLQLVVQALSLALTGDVDKDDRAQIEKTMREQVLEVGRYPTISFTTREVTAKHLRDGRYEVLLTGDLTLHGRTRAQRIGALVEVADDVLRAKGTLKFDQTDFGIEPPVAAAGTIKVADRVEIVFDLVARREP